MASFRDGFSNQWKIWDLLKRQLLSKEVTVNPENNVLFQIWKLKALCLAMADLRLTLAGNFFTHKQTRVLQNRSLRMTSLKVDGISSRTVVADLEYLFEK